MLIGLLGCAPGTFTAEEAGVVYEAVSSVNADAYADIYAFSAPDGDDGELATGKGLTWHTAADGGELSGTVEGPGSWTGTVEIDGTYTIEVVDGDAWVATWSLHATYLDVTYGDVVLEADLAWSLSAEADGSTFLHTSSVGGDIVARGEVTGAGIIDYLTIVSLSGGRYQVRTEGSVGGHDISAEYDATAFGL